MRRGAVWALIFSLLVLAVLAYLGNDCPANRNARYLAWRLENGKDPERIE